jgi:hypothetical protein
MLLRLEYTFNKLFIKAFLAIYLLSHTIFGKLLINSLTAWQA